MKGDVVMNNKEIKQIEIFEKLDRREIKQKKAGEILNLSERQIKRKLKAYRKYGVKSLMHKARGRNSNNRINKDLLNKAIKIIKNKYYDFPPTLAYEKLVENHDFKYSLSIIRKAMISEGLWTFKRKKKTKIFKLRKRRSCFGELVQLDGSPHAWFEDRGSRCNLNVSIDDATGEVSALFSKVESTKDYFKFIKNYIKKYGLPIALYTDKHSIFKINRKESDNFKKPGKNKNEGLTQFQRAMKELEIELIFANTPQAKGRVERVNKTLQNRLVKELRLNNISNIKDANKFLPIFLDKFNKKFKVKPESKINKHRKFKNDLNQILCFKETRILSKNLSISYKNNIFQIKTNKSSYFLRNNIVNIYEKLDGSIQLLDHKNKILKYTVFKKPALIREASSKTINKEIDDILDKQIKHSDEIKNPWESKLI